MQRWLMTFMPMRIWKSDRLLFRPVAPAGTDLLLFIVPAGYLYKKFFSRNQVLRFNFTESPEGLFLYPINERQVINRKYQ